MKKITMFLMSLSLMFISYCGDAPADGGGDSCDPVVQDFYDTFHPVLDSHSVVTSAELTNELDFYATFKPILLERTEAEVTALINAVPTDYTTQINFYNTWNSVVNGYTTTQVTTALAFDQVTVADNPFTLVKSIATGTAKSIRVIGMVNPTEINIKIYDVNSATMFTITTNTSEYFGFTVANGAVLPVIISGTFRMGNMVYRIPATVL